MADDRWWKDLDAVVAAMLAGGSRILDLGCGDGGLVDRLTELGFDPIGVDPHAPAHSRLIQARVEHATELGEFDAITATMSLHHADLPAVLEAINGHLRPDGRLFVSEFAWDAYDERAADWLADHDPSDSDNSIAGWRNRRTDHEPLTADRGWCPTSVPSAERDVAARCVRVALRSSRCDRMPRRRSSSADMRSSCNARRVARPAPGAEPV